MSRADRLAAALDLARLYGLRVFPLIPNTKRPAIRKFSEFATTNESVIRDWFDVPNPPNIAFSTDDLLLIDVDPRHGGDETFKALLATEPFPKTARSRTAGGGDHVVYRCPPGVKIKNHNRGLVLGTGVDVKGRGGYAVAPGSVIDGVAYRWANDRPIAEAPPWLVDRMQQARPRSEAAGKRLVEEDDEAVALATNWMLEHAYIGEDGSRNETAFRVAAKLYDFGVSQSTALDIMLEWNATKCFPPMDLDELQTVTNSAGRNRSQPIGHEHPSVSGVDPIDITARLVPADAKPRASMVSKEEFIGGFVPPDYLVDGVLQRGYVYAITAQTGHGKTALALLIAKLVGSTALNCSFGPHAVDKGRVVYFAGENPDDLRMRVIGDDATRTDDTKDNISFIPGIFTIEEMAAEVEAKTKTLGRVDFVIVDTSAAYFPGDDEISNTQMGHYARKLRTLTTLPGKPCVLVLCHPIKNVTDPAQLLPRGGGAFLAEMDGNLTLWAPERVQAELWHNKMRGPGFEPMCVKFETITTTKLVDSKGRLIPTVRAVVMSRQEQEAMSHTARSDEDTVLAVMRATPGLSLAGIADACGWKTQKGEPYKAKVQRTMDRLKASRLVDKFRGNYRLTEKGEAVARAASKDTHAASKGARPRDADDVWKEAAE
jgi:Bifunctional DNA primase/polymerase, N-terminal/AAA domain/Primase C terminal 1 (PriCT-1)